MEISNITEDDLEELSVLYQQLIPNDVSIASMRDVLRNNQNDSKHVVLVAKLDGKLVGSLLATICEMLFGQCKSFMVVEDVIVNSEYRQQGVGRDLMGRIEEHASHHNCSYIMLVTDRDRVGSQEFYKSLGYSTDEYRAFKKHL